MHVAHEFSVYYTKTNSRVWNMILLAVFRRGCLKYARVRVANVNLSVQKTAVWAGRNKRFHVLSIREKLFGQNTQRPSAESFHGSPADLSPDDEWPTICRRKQPLASRLMHERRKIFPTYRQYANFTQFVVVGFQMF